MRELSGIIHGLDEDEYHVRPELSSTQARQLLDSPARYHYAQSHPQEHKAAFDLGSAVHSRVLGVGAQIVAIPLELLATNGAASTKASKEFMEQARSDGLIPVKQDVADEVHDMTEAVLAHPEARALFEQDGNAEASVFATDPDTGVALRARFDFLPNFMQDDPWCVDLKTSAKKIDPESFSKTVADLGYDVQQEHYLHTASLAAGLFDSQMKFVVVETGPPYLVAVHELSREFAEIGQARARRARELLAACTASGEWPGYGHHLEPIQPPLWHIYQNQGILQ